MKKFKCLFNRVFISILFVCLGISSFAQFAGSVDTTFAPNNNGVPFSTSGHYRAMGVEIIDNSVTMPYNANLVILKLESMTFKEMRTSIGTIIKCLLGTLSLQQLT